MNITSNLHDALPHFRARSRNHSIWIDSIYTDQDNVSERNSQMNMIGRISNLQSWSSYGSASLRRYRKNYRAHGTLPDTTSDVAKRHPRPRSSANSKVEVLKTLCRV
ncbi:uncharacterized protein K441DRAFT_319359 [Cenococcum geophilum 1.58]|uniref:uncharacterized protein n=1 Tax=Cenococcum geophilum 1.58 TaxID=794803 RepID=UPI00358FFF87|nr:hypothetical protein K441DRAFT_319359 [Cenococcum geophilum 1.58]